MTEKIVQAVVVTLAAGGIIYLGRKVLKSAPAGDANPAVGPNFVPRTTLPDLIEV